jgi:hypothetical protein
MIETFADSPLVLTDQGSHHCGKTTPAQQVGFSARFSFLTAFLQVHPESCQQAVYED